MKPPAFDYQRVAYIEEALAALAQAGDDARVLAGGQSLMPILNMRLATPRLLLDISACAPLDSLSIENDTLVAGASLTQSRLEAHGELARRAPLLAQALPHVAHVQIRNRGTVCGSIAHADPSAELPLCLVALRGEVVLRAARGTRRVPAERFFLGPLTTDRRADELITAVRFPLRAHAAGHAFEEFSLRHGDYAVVALAAVVDGHGIRLAVGGVADRPQARQWPDLQGSALDDALNEFAWALHARDDAQASAKVRRHLVRELGRRVIERARRQAREDEEAHASAPAHLLKKGSSAVAVRPDETMRCTPSGPKQAIALPVEPDEVTGRLAAGTRRRVNLRVNGTPRQGEAGPRTLLTDFLRHELGLTGTHVGCEHGVCGACTVRIDGVAQRACLTLAAQAHGRALQTVECRDEDDALLARLRAAFKRHHALQCGYCTAGILMSCVEFLSRVPQPDEAQVRAMLSGHLCRCTGYTPIVRAILEAAAPPDAGHA